ncbi:MarR family winged helix-turn-helix transcriptional regulator [Azospirillum sp. A39]|uniref:MarR family winged helix-turn-helix transcriptional regulator n=1 Tax=Azospirillum sp. A39 TaxID=3462279 RepID=UPI004045A047
MKTAVSAVTDDMTAAAGDGPVDVEAAADLAARPETRLWLRLSAASALIDARLRGRLRTVFDATPARFDVMALLDKAPEGGLTMGELSKRLMVTNGNVTGIVERLVRDGLAIRTTVAGDRRTCFVRLTPDGVAAQRAMADAHEGWLTDLVKGLEREEMTVLLALLDRLKQSVRAATGEE